MNFKLNFVDTKVQKDVDASNIGFHETFDRDLIPKPCDGSGENDIFLSTDDVRTVKARYGFSDVKIKNLQSSPLCKSLYSAGRSKRSIDQLGQPHELADCARLKINPQKWKYFKLIIFKPGRNEVVTDASQLVKYHSSFILAQTNLVLLENTPSVLKRMAQVLIDDEPEKQYPVYIRPSRKFIHTHSGRFNPLNNRVHLVDSNRYQFKKGEWFRVDEYDRNNSSTFSHELGHAVMKKLYGSWPASLIQHDRRNKFKIKKNSQKNRATKFVNPRAGWTEGFARAMEYSVRGREVDAKFFLENDAIDWNKLSIRKKISNEYLVGSVLVKFIHSTMNGRMTISGLERLDKVFATMKNAGYHANFKDFLDDFLFFYPEEYERWKNVLIEYGMKDLLEAENGFEYYVQRYEAKNQRLPANSKARRLIWNRMKQEKGVQIQLLNPDKSDKEKLVLVREIEAEMPKIKDRWHSIKMDESEKVIRRLRFEIDQALIHLRKGKVDQFQHHLSMVIEWRKKWSDLESWEKIDLDQRYEDIFCQVLWFYHKASYLFLEKSKVEQIQNEFPEMVKDPKVFLSIAHRISLENLQNEIRRDLNDSRLRELYEEIIPHCLEVSLASNQDFVDEWKELQAEVEMKMKARH